MTTNFAQQVAPASPTFTRVPPGAGSAAYVAPFVAFVTLLAAAEWLSFLGVWEYVLRAVVLTVVLFVFSRHVISFRVSSVYGTVLMGVAVFAVWIAPDLLFPDYRSHFLFQNSITGHIRSSLTEDHRGDLVVLAFRAIRAIILVPIIEELFWRAWLMRYLINPHFKNLPLGAYSAMSMIVTALLFASEHGPYWDVGLIAGLLYNWWMVRTKSLGDCILAHSITNACLSAYVIVSGKWEYWL